MGEFRKRQIASAAAAFSEEDKKWSLAEIRAISSGLALDPAAAYHLSLLASVSTILFTDQVPMLAVEMINFPGDPDHRRVIMWVNAHGFRHMLCACDTKEPGKFGVLHELEHIADGHLRALANASPNVDPQLLTLAQETYINGKYVHQRGLELPGKDGKPIVVDPDAVHRSYVQAAKKQGKTHLSLRNFLYTTDRVYNELASVQKPVAQKQMSNVCGSHSQGAPAGPGEGSEGDQGNQGTWSPGENDPQVTGDVMERIYAAATKAAEAGNKKAAQDLQDVMEQHPEAEKLWSSTGADKLRARSTRNGKGSTVWTRHVRNTLASKIGTGHRWVWNRRTPWEDRFVPRGKMPRKHGSVFIDSSGSMPSDLIERVSTLVGKLDGVTVDWHWFDASVGPFVPGGEILGGGGTSFQAIEDHLCGKDGAYTAGKGCCRRYPDFVVVLTDGYAPEVQPSRPSRWVWLVTPGGDMWPEKAGMSTHEVNI